MKKLIAIAMCTLMILGAVACVKKADPKPAEPDPTAAVEPDVNPVEDPTVDPEKDPNEEPEPITDPEPDPNEPDSPEEPVDEPSEEPEPEQQAEIDYDNLFDFSGWEADYETAEDKQAFIEEFWKNTTTKTLLENDNYNLIKNDEKAKAAFLDEFKTQMTAQMERMLTDEGVEIDDSVREMISKVIDEQLVSISNAFN